MGNACRYLSQFEGVDRAYALLLEDAAKRFPAVNFNGPFACSDQALTESYEVFGALSAVRYRRAMRSSISGESQAACLLKPVQRAREHRSPLVPYDLLVMLEADAQQPVEDLTGEFGCMPNVGSLQARHEFKRFGPVGARVAGDCRFGVADGALSHI